MTMNRIRSFLMGMAALAALTAPAAAQQPEPIRITAVNRTAASEAARGTPRRDQAARPGDVLRYRLTFTNPAAQQVRGVVLSDPVPAGLRFVSGSASADRADVAVEYSIDGGRSWAAQPMETVVVDGQRVQRPAPPEKYTNVRWTVGGWVAPGATVIAEFDARVGGAPRAGQQETTGAPRIR
jgi:uncharacterized repeat protein (TIGR01451 family)